MTGGFIKVISSRIGSLAKLYSPTLVLPLTNALAFFPNNISKEDRKLYNIFHQEVVEDPVNFLSRKLPDGDGVAEEANDPNQGDQKTLSHPFEVVDGHPKAGLHQLRVKL